MTHETYGRSSAASLIADTFNDLSELLRKEMRLASAEMSNAVATSLRASVMMAMIRMLWSRDISRSAGRPVRPASRCNASRALSARTCSETIDDS